MLSNLSEGKPRAAQGIRTAIPFATVQDLDILIGWKLVNRR
jgi:hypothetical protein